MADINLEERRRARWGPWLLGLVLLVLGIWVVAELLDTDEVPVAEEGIEVLEPAPAAEVTPLEPGSPTALPDAVQRFESQCAVAGPEQTDMGRQHQFTSNCIGLMVQALDAAVQADTVDGMVLSQKLEALRTDAQELRESDPSALTHAGTVQDAMRSSADLVTTLQSARHPDDSRLEQSASELERIAGEIDTQRPLLEQRQVVQRFFDTTAETLRALER